MNRKKILIIAPNLTKGGTERQLSLFLEHFDRKAFAVTLALFTDKIEYPIPIDVERINLDKRRRIDLFFLQRLYKLIKNGEFHIINSKISGVNEYTLFLCGLLNIKSVVLEVRSSGMRMFKYYKRMKLIHFLFKNSFTVICNSKKALIELEKYLLSPKISIKVVPNGIDTHKFFIQDRSENKVSFTIGFVGRIEKIKNIETLIKAIGLLTEHKKHNDIELYLVGNKDTFHFSEINSLVRRMNLQNICSFADVVNNTEEYYNKFDLFILPSHMEGTPNALLEAMSCGCVCLISEGANSDNFLEKKFEFQTTNTKQLAEKIEYIFNLTHEERKAIGMENRMYVNSNYSVGKMVDSLSEIYSSI